MKSRLHHSPKVETMKCVWYAGHIERLPNEQAHELVASGRAKYAKKKDWKAKLKQEKEAA